MTIDIEAIKASADLVQVIGRRVELHKRAGGREWAGLCPFHGESTPSFQVVPAKGFYHCFGCGAHGDVFDFLREAEGLTLPEAAEALGGALPERERRPPPPPPPEWQHSMPPADQQEPRSFRVGDLGEPVAKWPYRAADGSVIGWVGRYEDDGKKIPMAWTWGTDGTHAARWALRQFSRPRPLFGLDRLAERPEAQVIIGEGEKTVTAMMSLFPRQVAVGWPGGGNGVRHADWEPMRGRRVVLVPDADQPGRDAMAWLAAHLEGIGCNVKTVDPEADRPSGWDLADALAEGWDSARAMAWVKARLVAGEVVAAPAPAPAAPPPAVEPPAAEPPPAAPAPAPEPKKESIPDKMRRFSDIGLAERFVAEDGKDWCYVATWGKWYAWRGDHWAEDERAEVQEAAKGMLKRAESSPGASVLSDASRRSLLGANTVKNMLKMASSAPQIAVVHTMLDADPWLLGVPGGVVDLRTGEVLPARRDQLVTKQCAVAPRREIPALWLAFLEQVLMGRQDQIDFLQRFLGYALIGKVWEPGLVFFHGGGGNGKGVILQVCIDILQGYAVSADFGTFAEQEYGERHSTDIARLAGARLIITEEGKEGQRLNDGLIKKLTGGGKQTARFIAQDNFEFEVVGKILIASNHRPSLSSVGEDMRRRVNMVPFDYTVPASERDMHLGEKLRAEFPEILQWMIEGALRWQEDGLSPPESIQAASRGYIASQDVVSEWMAECCTVGKGLSEPAKLLRSWQKWCEQNGEHALGRIKFMERLLMKPGLNEKTTSQGKMVDGIIVNR